MPSPDVILGGLTSLANAWRGFAIAWHITLLLLIVSAMAGWRPSERAAGRLLLAPLASVSALAWSTGNPFNAIVFAALAATLVVVASRLPPTRIEFASPAMVLFGVSLLAFGWIYPHFLVVDSSLEHLYAAPFALIPCPTLAVLIGVTLMTTLAQCRRWTSVLGGAGLLYGTIGVFTLGVLIDTVLLAGAALLVVRLGLVGRLNRQQAFIQ
jgi:hypothetical protein